MNAAVSCFDVFSSVGVDEFLGTLEQAMVGPWECSIGIVVDSLLSLPSAGIGIALMTLGGLLYAFDGSRLSWIGWLWPARKVAWGLVGFGTALNVGRFCVWMFRN